MIVVNTFLILTGWLLIVYGVAASLFIIGLLRSRKALRRDFEKWPSVSVVLPARNEAEVLERTIRSLLTQDYPGTWEIIVVDDRSTDETPDILNRYAEENPRFRFRTVTEPNPPSPKKYALSKGIEIATGEIICTTDADCVFHPRWLRSMISHFRAPVGVVAGLTRFKTADGREVSLFTLTNANGWPGTVVAKGAKHRLHAPGLSGSGLDRSWSPQQLQWLESRLSPHGL